MNLSVTQNNLLLENTYSHKRAHRSILAILSCMAGLAVFEVFNYATTSFALRGLLGSSGVMGISMATWLAVVVCCLDGVGILCLFLTPSGTTRSYRDRRLFGVWLLVAGLNTWLTWHGIGLAIVIRQVQSGWVVDPGVLINTLPVFTVCLIWLIRVLVIGSLSRPLPTQPVMDNNMDEPNLLEEASRIQASLPFELLPHGSIDYYPPFFQYPLQDSYKGEPTYRGIPVQYKTC